MANKQKCVVCTTSRGKRKCAINNNSLVCPICCAKQRDIDKCHPCIYIETSQEFAKQKDQKSADKLSNIFGSSQLQKAIMEASISLMNNHKEQGEIFDNDTEVFKSESFIFFNQDEFSEFYFTEDEIKSIIKKQNEPLSEPNWFHSEDGQKYYTNATDLIMDKARFTKFSKKLFRIFLKYYNKGDIKNAWLLLATCNHLMEGDYQIPFVWLMFFRGISTWKLK